MELRQLEYFVAVVEEASFTRAATRCRVAQPGVSAQVRRLEQELGEALLDRSGRTVRATEVGAAVLPHARAALEAIAGVRQTVDELAGLTRGRVAVGMVVACGSMDLPAMLADFHRAHPAVEISLAEDNSDRMLAALQRGDLDLALVGLAGPPPNGIETQTIVDEPLVATVAHDDPLAGRERITLEALQRRPLISLPRGTGLRTCLDDACATAGIEPRIALEASNLEVLVELAVQGLGIAILPASTAAEHHEQLHALTVTRPHLQSALALAWRDGTANGPAARALIAHARVAHVGPAVDPQPA
jgi:DNA-binding transcriptional LysR family regulator